LRISSLLKEVSLILDLAHKLVQSLRTIIAKVPRWPDHLMQSAGYRKVVALREWAEPDLSQPVPGFGKFHSLHAKRPRHRYKRHHDSRQLAIDLKRNGREEELALRRETVRPQRGNTQESLPVIGVEVSYYQLRQATPVFRRKCVNQRASSGNGPRRSTAAIDNGSLSRLALAARIADHTAGTIADIQD
jgi:hypothetical protein